ncbi:MAG: ATP-binding cassette domain-containing protein [Planctomycetes bacterium]|nr:ATP-binding cassette domain-containing protein [Planctomycetota bacterium]MBL7145077.1 ATP-binding cassette domain-containing protein [Phycisphaerae bacterium]
MNLNIQAFNIITPNEKNISFEGVDLTNTNKLLITADDLEIARIVALAAFNFDKILIKLSGYNVEYSKVSNLKKQTVQNAYTSPNPRAEVSRFSTSVEEEVTLGLNTKVLEAESNELLNFVSQEIGISHLLKRNPLNLSGGEVAKVILASHLIHMPKIWIIDRTLNELDNQSRNSFLGFLNDKKILPDTLVIVIDYPELLASVRFDAVWKVSETKVDVNHKIKNYLTKHEDFFSNDLSISKTKVSDNKSASLKIENLNIWRGDKLVIENLSCEFCSGQISWVIGKNGSGKTTLFEALTNIITNWTGTIQYNHNQKKHPLSEMISYSPQETDIDITEDNLINEISFAMDKIKYNEQSKMKAKKWLLNIGMTEYEIINNTLNKNGDRKLASVLSAFARNKPIVILDEPSLFLSQNEMNYLNGAIKNHIEQDGIVIIATHDPRLFI